jgi:hypothetical protein
MAQIFLEHQSVRRHFVGGELFQYCIQLFQACDQRLILSRRAERLFHAERSMSEHAFPRYAGIAAAERGVARQHDLPHSLRESGRPTPRPLRATIDEAMSDRFGLCEAIWGNATVQIMRRANAQVRRLVHEQGVVGHEEETV